MLYRITEFEARAEYRLWLRFEDGVEGEADLSDVAGQGVFKRWKDNPAEFAEVEIDPETGSLTWPGDLDVASDRLHWELMETSTEVRPTAIR
jgi:hypothetical protein